MTFLNNILSLLTPREKRRGALVLISAVFRMGTIDAMNRRIEMRARFLEA